MIVEHRPKDAMTQAFNEKLELSGFLLSILQYYARRSKVGLGRCFDSCRKSEQTI